MILAQVDWLSAVGNIGFPIVVAAFLLFKLPKDFDRIATRIIGTADKAITAMKEERAKDREVFDLRFQAGIEKLREVERAVVGRIDRAARDCGRKLEDS